jgi:hypothetical protein
LLAKSVGALRRIADLHPAVFSVSDWSAPESTGGAQKRYPTAELRATKPESQQATASQQAPINARPQPTAEPRQIERAAGKLIAK